MYEVNTNTRMPLLRIFLIFTDQDSSVVSIESFGSLKLFCLESFPNKDICYIVQLEFHEMVTGQIL